MVRQEDLIRFDRLVFGRKGNLFDLLLAGGPAPAQSIPPNQVKISWNAKFKKEFPTFSPETMKNENWFQVIPSSSSSRQVHFGMENPMDRFLDLSSEASLSLHNLWFSALQKLVRGAARGGQLCLKRSLFQYNDVVGDEALECNGYLDLKAPPSPYAQRRDSTQDKAPVHPSIAGFPRKVKNEWKFFVKLIHLFFFRKAYRSVTFKGSQTVQIPKCCSSLGIAIEGSNIDLISCKPEKAL